MPILIIILMTHHVYHINMLVLITTINSHYPPSTRHNTHLSSQAQWLMVPIPQFTIPYFFSKEVT